MWQKKQLKFTSRYTVLQLSVPSNVGRFNKKIKIKNLCTGKAFLFNLNIFWCLHELKWIMSYQFAHYPYTECHICWNLFDFLTFYLYRQKHFSVFTGDDHGFLTVSLSRCFTLGYVFSCVGQYFCIIIQTKWLHNVVQLLLLRFNSEVTASVIRFGGMKIGSLVNATGTQIHTS